jgi:hypothetical protein
MTRKYTKDNPLPRAELARLRRNTDRRILRRKKAETAQTTQSKKLAQNKKLNDADSASLRIVIKELVREYVFAENDAATLAGRKLKNLFTEYELTRQDLLAAVKRTDWAKLHNEILELEIKKGMDEINAGYYITIETKEDMEIFLANIRRRGLRRLKAKQKLKNQPVV